MLMCLHLDCELCGLSHVTKLSNLSSNDQVVCLYNEWLIELVVTSMLCNI